MYNPEIFEKKWQDKWYASDIFKAIDHDVEEESAKTVTKGTVTKGKELANKNWREKMYVLVEFPYPSGAGMHIGHARNYSMMDAYARLHRMLGYNVLYPMGWDTFGLPAENYAIKVGRIPQEVTKENNANFKKQLKSLGLSFDWSREIDTADPKYYKWTQWMFLKFLEHDMAYKAEMPINWCPKCKCGCANEEVVDGKHERCGTEVSQKLMSQWMLRITKYADRLIDELDLVDFPKSVVASQKNWIGRKEWIDITYLVDGTNENLVVSTTRPDTNFGVTFIAVAPEHEVLQKLSSSMPEECRKAVDKYVSEAKAKSVEERAILDQEKTGVFTGLYAVNQLNDEKMPIYVADFVLTTVGTGVVVGVPGHDKRDFQFAKAMDLPIKRVVVGEDGDESAIVQIEQVQEENGVMVNSGFLNGMQIQDAIEKMMTYLEKKDWGKRVTRYNLHDWVFSRQRYWGEPIPVVFCDKCGTVPVPEDKLPLELPLLEDYSPTDDGKSPLERVTDWVNTICPKCGGKAKRETDVMPNWAGSNWYFLRYLDANNNDEFVSRAKLEQWMPIDIYDGGSEHTTLHLLYSRFCYKFLGDIGLVLGKEPYAKRRVHGMVLGEGGVKMSKSLGNVLNPDKLVEEYGSDTARCYLMFMGPYSGTCEWNSRTIVGVRRFLARYYDCIGRGSEMDEDNSDVQVALAKLAKKIEKDIKGLKFNTAIASAMEFLNECGKAKKSADQIKAMIKLIVPFAPHMAEELWESVGGKFSVSLELWPVFDEVEESTMDIPVQIDGKIRDVLTVERSVTQKAIKKMVFESEKVKKFTDGKKTKDYRYVEGRIVSISFAKK